MSRDNTTKTVTSPYAKDEMEAYQPGPNNVHKARAVSSHQPSTNRCSVARAVSIYQPSTRKADYRGSAARAVSIYQPSTRKASSNRTEHDKSVRKRLITSKEMKRPFRQTIDD